MIEVKDLVKRYNGRVAVDHLSFTVADGQIYGFLGPNGAGKSTTMNIMTGCLSPTEGEVLLNGCDIQKEPERAKKMIGYLPEVPPLYPDMTVQEYLQFAAALKKISFKEQAAAIESAISVTKLDSVRFRLIKNLSKGYRQRTGLAQALLGNPPILILDEPTVGLDPKQIIEIRELIANLGKEHTVILSSHILSEINAVCDRVLIIAHGRLIACDTPGNLERQFAETRRIELTVRGTPEEVRKTLVELPAGSVGEVTLCSGEEGMAAEEHGVRSDGDEPVSAAREVRTEGGGPMPAAREMRTEGGGPMPAACEVRTEGGGPMPAAREVRTDAGGPTAARGVRTDAGGPTTARGVRTDAGGPTTARGVRTEGDKPGPAARGLCSVSFDVTTREDLRETVFWAFANRRLPILSMTQTKATLEEVFLELTGGDGATQDRRKSGEGANQDGSVNGEGAVQNIRLSDGRNGACDMTIHDDGEEALRDAGNL